MSEHPKFSWPVNIADVGAAGLTKRVEANARERADLAAALKLVEVSTLAAELTLTRDGRGIIHVDGRLTADIVQSCVVSLVPVPQRIDEPVSLRFVEQGAAAAASPPRAPSEVRVDPTEDDPPEVLSRPVIDLGPIVIEHFILAIDPYPRAPGAALPENPAEDLPGAGDSPFAVLAGLGRPKAKDR